MSIQVNKMHKTYEDELSNVEGIHKVDNDNKRIECKYGKRILEIKYLPRTMM